VFVVVLLGGILVKKDVADVVIIVIKIYILIKIHIITHMITFELSYLNVIVYI